MVSIGAMTDGTTHQRKPGLLVPPTFAQGEPLSRKPTLREVLVEWVDAVNFFKDSSRLSPALYALYHMAGFAVFLAFLIWHFSVVAILIVLGIACMIATIYNTVWYHRYCSHRAFKFRNIWWARLFLWTNPVCFREESYVIPHRVHHSKPDQPGDPYGPHLGWLGSYLATESSQRTNRNISEADYLRLAKSLEHVGFVKNTYAGFQQTGSVENVSHYVVKMLFVNLFWSVLAFMVAGWTGVMVWMSGVFLYTFVVRDFNYRGHGGLFGTQPKGLPLNQVIYGIIAGEWHGNHHAYPRSARSGLAWWQVDLPYWFIKLMNLCGGVSSYNAPDKHALVQPLVSSHSA